MFIVDWPHTVTFINMLPGFSTAALQILQSSQVSDSPVSLFQNDPSILIFSSCGNCLKLDPPY